MTGIQYCFVPKADTAECHMPLATTLLVHHVVTAQRQGKLSHASKGLSKQQTHRALQDTSQTSQWHVPANTIIQVGRLLKPGEDEIAQVIQQIVSAHNTNDATTTSAAICLFLSTMRYNSQRTVPSVSKCSDFCCSH